MTKGDEVPCTSMEQDWGDDQPNMLMHPPCACPQCAPEPLDEADEGSWLQLPGKQHRFRVEPAELGARGHNLLG